MRLKIPVEVEAPDDATHYTGDLNEMTFYKKNEIGVSGEHWFYWNPGGWKNRKPGNKAEWRMVSHSQPHFIKLIPEEWKK